jgi:putative Mn2+ efflux pump MntP
MDLLTNILIGASLAMDCAAVSMAGGANSKGEETKKALLAGLFFGGFQAGMMAVGWFGGNWLKTIVSDYDHWMAFFLLGFVGAKMVVESLRHHEEKKTELLDYRVLFALAIATSIDALIVGTGMALADSGIMMMVLVVGLVTAAISIISVFIGSRYGSMLGTKAETIGGITLIIIGASILLEHLGYIR